MKQIDVGTIVIDNINSNDYPDFCDAFVSEAKYWDGESVSEEDLIKWEKDNSDEFYEMILESCY